MSKLVLVTGATGYVGFRTLIETLKAGYRVRAAVRNEGGVQKVKAAASTQPYLNQLEFVYVADILRDDAYDEAVQGVDAIIHLASPTTNQKTPPTEETFDETLIQPAVKGTMNIIKSASEHSPTTKRIVITASIVSIVQWPEVYMETGTVFDETSRTSTVKGPYGNIGAAYGASKIAALNATEEYVRTQRPHFDINHIGPGFVIGHHELALTRADIMGGTNKAALGPMLGTKGGPTPSASVFVDDVARMHVLALDPKIAGGQFFLGVSQESTTRWNDAIEIVKRECPRVVENGVFPLRGDNPTKRLVFNTEYTQKTLGITFATYEEQVKSVAGYYAGLKE